MRRWLRRQENESGEWSVADLFLGYRICAYHHEHYGGVHLHHPLTAPMSDHVDVHDADEASTIMERYHEAHDAFDIATLHEVIARWRSASEDA